MMDERDSRDPDSVDLESPTPEDAPLGGQETPPNAPSVPVVKAPGEPPPPPKDQPKA
jgi:hypothetical protein